MDAGQPARAPALPFLAVCAGWPFCFHALTDWFSRRRSVTWAIGNICRMQLLNLGTLGRLVVQKLELCAALTLAAWQPGTL